MNSQHRRMERYRILYAWKILEGLVPDCGMEWEEESINDRKGRRLKNPKFENKITKRHTKS